MRFIRNTPLVAAIVLAAAAIIILKQTGLKTPKDTAVMPAPAANLAEGNTPIPQDTPPPAIQKKALPRLLDLGADKCVPCKMMAPILVDLKTTYAGKMDVEFIDVWENPDAGETYGIKMIPTQIFFDAEGKELFRHEGFFGKEDILAKWKELGVETGAAVVNTGVK